MSLLYELPLKGMLGTKPGPQAWANNEIVVTAPYSEDLILNLEPRTGEVGLGLQAWRHHGDI